MNLYKINSFKEYLDVIKKIKQENNLVWFRGQEDSSWRLVPKVIRSAVDIKNQYGEDIEPKPAAFCDTKGEISIMPNVYKMIEEFKELAKGYLRIEPKNEFEWMFLAQHYGLPTKLLDWSTDPLVALFFSMPENIDESKIEECKLAVKNDEIEEFDDFCCSVFAVNPCELNKLLLCAKVPESYKYLPLDVIDDFSYLEGYLKNKIPFACCIAGSPIDKRICRQSGNFTIHGAVNWPLDFIEVVRKILYKIIIPYTVINEIKEWLNILDITKESIYGESELDKIAKTITKEEKKRFLNEINVLKKKYK